MTIYDSTVERLHPYGAVPCVLHVYRQGYASNDKKPDIVNAPVSFESLGDEGLRKFATFWLTMSPGEQRAAEILTTFLGGWQMPLELPLTFASAMVEVLGKESDKKQFTKSELKDLEDGIAEAAPEE